MPEEDIDLYGEYEDDHYEEPVRFAPFERILRKTCIHIHACAQSTSTIPVTDEARDPAVGEKRQRDGSAGPLGEQGQNDLQNVRYKRCDLCFSRLLLHVRPSDVDSDYVSPSHLVCFTNLPSFVMHSSATTVQTPKVTCRCLACLNNTNNKIFRLVTLKMMRYISTNCNGSVSIQTTLGNILTVFNSFVFYSGAQMKI
jgi:hypothetical protein